MIRNSAPGPTLAEITPETLLLLTAERVPASLAALFARGASPSNRKTLLWEAAKLLFRARLDRAAEAGDLPPPSVFADQWITPSPQDIARWPFAADIPWSAAVGAYTNTSHVPERRAARAVYDYAAHLLKMQALLGEDFAEYRPGYRQAFNAWLRARANTASTMITGGAGFNVRRAQKANASADNRWAEVEAYTQGFMRRRQREARRAARQGGGVLEDLRAQVKRAEELQESMKAANAELRKVKTMPTDPDQRVALARRISEKTLMHPDDVLRAMSPDFMGRVGFASYKTQNNLANIKRLHARIADEEAKAQRAAVGGEDFTRTIRLPEGDVDVRYNREEDRLQLTFARGLIDSAQLKRGGWRWSPSRGVWQRQLTDNAVSGATFLLDRAGNTSGPLPYLSASLSARPVEPEPEPEGDALTAAEEAEVAAELAEIGMVEPGGDEEDEAPAPADTRRNSSAERPFVPTLRARTGLALGPDRAFDMDFDRPGDDGNTRARMADGYGAIWRVPTVSVRRWIEDLNAHLVDVPRGLDRRVDEVLDGRARFAGKGNDGLVWITPSGWAVKADTVVLYQPQNDGQRTPEQAARHLEHEADVHRALADLPMVPRCDVVRTPGGRVLLIKPALDTAPVLDRSDLLAVEATVKAIHERGWIIGDRVQVGRAPDGRLYIFDLGSARRGDTAYEREGDKDYLRLLWRDAGFQRPTDPDHSAKQAEFYTRMVLGRLNKGERPSESTLKGWREHTTAHGANLIESDFDAYMQFIDRIEEIEDRLRALPGSPS